VNADDFVVVTDPLSSIPVGESSDFVIEFSPSASGLRTAEVTISSNDPDENPYSFSIQGAGGQPEIEVSGLDNPIEDGDAEPSVTNGTNFGVVALVGESAASTFVIENTGDASLSLGGSPLIGISGTNASEFTVTLEPDTTVSAEGGVTTFTIEFSPEAAGLRTAEVSIVNSDADENPFSFSIQGLGGQPEIAVSGIGNFIENGDEVPSETDGTDFGVVSVVGQSAVSSFTLENNGDDVLTLTGAPLIEISGPGASEFAVTLEPETSIAAGGGFSSFEVTFTPVSVGISTASISIASDDSDASPYVFNVTGEGGLDNDSDGDPDVTDPDDDNDGVSDIQEDADGTDGLSADSFVERNGSTVCINWNGFLGFLTQVLELSNTSATDIEARVELFDIAGAMQESREINFPVGVQRDFIVNDMAGFASDTYGSVCATITSGPDDGLDGQLLFYQLEEGSFNLAFQESIAPGRSGSQFMSFNTIYPTVNPAQAANVLVAFIQISNEENTAESGELIFFDQAGNEIRRVEVGLAASERRDVDVQSVGSSIVGKVEWRPEDSSSSFRVVQNRYYFGSELNLNQLIAATSVPARRASGRTLVVPFDTRSRLTALEISNALDVAINVTVNVTDETGLPAPTSPSEIVLEPRATTNVLLNSFISSGFGSATIASDTPGSLVVSNLEYGLDDSGNLMFALIGTPTEGAGEVLRGSYNNFLGQCRLRLANLMTTEQEAIVSMTRFDGEVVLESASVSVPGSGAVEMDLCINENPASGYGEVLVSPALTGAVSGEVIRSNLDGTSEVAVPLRE